MKTIWLASYPKSGNTWLRLLLANYLVNDHKPVDINAMPVHDGIASGRLPFDNLLLIDSGLLTHDEIDRLRPRVYEALASGATTGDDEPGVAPVRFVKVHDAYISTSKAEPLLAGRKGADGAIVIVRDPRDIAPSLAGHNRSTVDEAIAFMENKDTGFCVAVTRQNNQFRQKLQDWSGHVGSWLDQTDIPVHLVRYEDMTEDAGASLEGVLTFAGLEAAPDKVRRAVDFSKFGELRAQERERGFREAPRPNPAGDFFRRGEAGAWRDELTTAQVARIEAGHAGMMRRLGYDAVITGARMSTG